MLKYSIFVPKALGPEHRPFLTLKERKLGVRPAVSTEAGIEELCYSKACSPQGLHFRK